MQEYRRIYRASRRRTARPGLWPRQFFRQSGWRRPELRSPPENCIAGTRDLALAMAVVMKLTAKEHPALNSKIVIISPARKWRKKLCPLPLHPGTLSLHTVYICTVYIYICRHTTGPVQIVLERKSRKLFYSGKYVTTGRICFPAPIWQTNFRDKVEKWISYKVLRCWGAWDAGIGPTALN